MSIIEKPRFVRAQIKRLTTKDGLGTLTPNVRTGDIFLVDLRSIRQIKCTNTNGHEHEKSIINVADENGKAKGWMYCECFFL